VAGGILTTWVLRDFEKPKKEGEVVVDVELKEKLERCKRECEEVMYAKSWLTYEEEEGLVDAIERDVSDLTLMIREVGALADGVGKMSVG